MTQAYLRNRYYDPSVGRFISEDPAKDGSNWYVYCGNNPVMFVDPSGLVVTDWDRMFCTSDEIKKLEENDEKWNNGNEYEKKEAADSSRKIRQRHLRHDDTFIDTILDNGYIESIEKNFLDISAVSSAVFVYTSITVERIYTDVYTVVGLKNVYISIHPNSGFHVNSVEVTSGQADIFENSNTFQKLSQHQSIIFHQVGEKFMMIMVQGTLLWDFMRQ